MRIYVLDLHGNSLKKEKCTDGSKDENVFDIMQGTAIILMIKGVKTEIGISHHELYGLRSFKYDWLDSNAFDSKKFQSAYPKLTLLYIPP